MLRDLNLDLSLDLSSIPNINIINFQFNDGNGVRLRYDPLSSEMVEGKMVLKILKPPRNKDSLGSLTGQSLSWVFNVRNLYVIQVLLLNIAG